MATVVAAFAQASWASTTAAAAAATAHVSSHTKWIANHSASASWSQIILGRSPLLRCSRCSHRRRLSHPAASIAVLAAAPAATAKGSVRRGTGNGLAGLWV
jgi:hypothetical protein